MFDTAECTAVDFATADPESLPAGERVGTARKWLVERGYDVAPVVDDNQPIGYIELTTFQEAPADDPIQEYLSEIQLRHLITPDAGFARTLTALYERPWYFLGGQDSLTAILTRADLNTAPARQHLFSRITDLERALRQVIQQEVPEWRDRATVSPDIIDDIDKRYEEAQENSVELPRIHYAQFSTLASIVSEFEACRDACGFDTEHEASSQLADLTDLRNDVAHATPIIQNTERGLGERGRTVTDLLEQYDLLEELLGQLDQT